MVDDISDDILKHRETCLTTWFSCFKRLHELQGSHILWILGLSLGLFGKCMVSSRKETIKPMYTHVNLGLTQAHNWRGYTHLAIGFKSQIDSLSPPVHHFLSFNLRLANHPQPVSLVHLLCWHVLQDNWKSSTIWRTVLKGFCRSAININCRWHWSLHSGSWRV